MNFGTLFPFTYLSFFLPLVSHKSFSDLTSSPVSKQIKTFTSTHKTETDSQNCYDIKLPSPSTFKQLVCKLRIS